MKKTVAIIGGGASSLLLSASLDTDLFDVSIYEKNKTLGRKFLVAGDGGFNLTHSEKEELFIIKYLPPHFLNDHFSLFNNIHLREWLNKLGIETYIGSSGRIFPIKTTKPIDVLNAFINKIKEKKVLIKTQHEWKGWQQNDLLFKINNEELIVKSDLVIFALGGGSWKITGSDGNWVNYFKEKKINVIPFEASNCSFKINWKNDFIKSAAGQSLKNVMIKCDDIERKGELVITEFGIEGGAIYALSERIRKQLSINNTALVYIDLKPQLSIIQIKSKLINRGNNSLTKQLSTKLSMNSTQIALLKNSLSKEDFINIDTLCASIKKLPIVLTGIAPIDEAISTIGGIALAEIDINFELKILPNHFVIGEMLDWDAPTGGYLLQGCFTMAHALAMHLNKNER
ncbi:MAG: TIGR03862 family flavoprotein [Bacteroidia bacterium]